MGISVKTICIWATLVLLAVGTSPYLASGSDANKVEPDLSARKHLLQSHLEKAKKDIEANVFGSVTKKMLTKVGPPKLTLTGSTECKLCYTIIWAMDPRLIKSTLSKYFSVSAHFEGSGLEYINLKRRSGKQEYADPLYSYLVGYPVNLLVDWNKEKILINITEVYSSLDPNWSLYFKGSRTYCRSGLSEKHLKQPQDITAKLVFNTFRYGGTGPIVEWRDIYGREEIGQRSVGSVSLGIDSRGGGSEYYVRGQFSEMRGEYHGAWASFREERILWNRNRILQLATEKGNDSGWYTKKHNLWVKE